MVSDLSLQTDADASVLSFGRCGTGGITSKCLKNPLVCVLQQLKLTWSVNREKMVYDILLAQTKNTTKTIPKQSEETQ